MPAPSIWSRFFFRGWSAAGIALLGGLGLTYVMYAALSWSQSERMHAAFRQTADFESHSIRETLERVVEETDPICDDVATNRIPSSEHFSARAANLIQRHGIFQSVFWVPFARPGEKLIFDQATGSPGDPRIAFLVTEENGLAASWHVLRSEPSRAMGESFSVEPARQNLLRALNEARSTRRMVLTASGVTPKDKADPVVQIVRPVEMQAGDSSQSLPVGAFGGCVVATIRIRDLIAASRTTGPGTIADLTVLDSANGISPLYSSLPLATDGNSRQTHIDWIREQPIRMGGRIWLARHEANPAWLSSERNHVPEEAALGGLLITIFAVFRGWRTLRHTARKDARFNDCVAELQLFKLRTEEENRERTELEIHLRSSQHQLHALMENSPSAIFMKDAQGRYLTVNRRFAEMHGRTREHFVGRSDLDVFPPEVAARLRLSDTRVLSSGKTIEMEDSMGVAHGAQTSIIHKFPLMDEAGNVQGLCGIATDISERKRAEAEVRESRRQLESLLGQLPGMAFRFVNDGQFTPVYVSRGALGLTGHSARDFLEGMVKLENVIHPEDRERARTAIAVAVKKRRSFEVEYRLVDRSGRVKWVLERGQGVYDEDGKLLFIEGLAIDITQRKDAESEKLLVERRLLEGQKLESIGVLAGGIAHDFNNLLTGIIGNANLASLELPTESRLQGNLKQIEIASQRAAELCQQMLAYAGKGRFIVQRVELGSLVENTVPLLRASISKRAQLRFKLTAGLPHVLADPTQMRQIVMNLVLNASEALGDHDGEIVIATDSLRPTADYFAGAVLAPPDLNHDFVMLQVRDTGSGMGPETLAKIFDPFFTTKFAGRGLGLAAVLGIIRSHKGGLKVVTASGQGSTFTLYFPIIPGPAEASPVRRGTSGPWRQEGLALVIDDEDHVRNVTAGMLHSCGLRTDLARDGYEGLDLFRSKPQDFDIVVLDMTMPRLSGEETLQLLREVRPDVRVLFMSGYNRREVVDTLAGTGALSFIQKPFTLESLRDQLQDMLR